MGRLQPDSVCLLFKHFVKSAVTDEETNDLKFVRAHRAAVEPNAVTKKHKESFRVPIEVPPDVGDCVQIDGVHSPRIWLVRVLLEERRKIAREDPKVVPRGAHKENFIDLRAIELAYRAAIFGV